MEESSAFTSAKGHPVPLEERVRLERTRIFFGLAKGNMAGILLGTLFIGSVLHLGGTSGQALATWTALLSVSWLAVVLYERRVLTIGVTADNCNELLHTRIALGACVAFLWGVAGYLLPSTGTQAHDTYIFIILTTLVTVGALGYSAMPAYYIILNVISLVPLSVKFAYQYLAYGENYYLLLVAMSVMWQIIVMTKARRTSRTVIDAIALNERLKDEIEEHKRTRAQLQLMAHQDPLTQLANRALFSDRLQQTLAYSLRTHARFALLYLDLDEFKPVNDQYGHGVGDLLLKAVARRLLECVREADTVARVGGDEFVGLLRDMQGSEGALNVAEKIRAALGKPFVIEGKPITIGCSIGVALFPEHGRSELELSRKADGAMYQAKMQGKNTVQLAA